MAATAKRTVIAPNPTAPATVFATAAAQVPTYINDVLVEWVMFGAKAHKLQIEFFRTTTAAIIVDIFDVDLNDQIGHFTLSTPDYAAIAADPTGRTRINFTATDRFSTLPTGVDSDGANFSGIWPESYIELDNSAIVESAAVYSQNTGSGDNWEINPANITTPAQARKWHPADDFDEVIEVGPGKTYEDPETALLALSDPEYLAAHATEPLQIAVPAYCPRANPLHRIGLLIHPRDSISPLLPWRYQNLHVQNFVGLVGVDPNGCVFEQPPGATRPIFQWHLSHDIANLTVRNTAPNPTPSATASATYGAHSDYVHNYMTADAEGDLLREYFLRVRNCNLIVGPNADVQVFGEGLPVNRETLFEDTTFNCENSSFAGALAAANNSSNTVGGGIITFRRCTDASNRTDTATVSVQAKQNNTNPNILRIEACTGFDRISIAGATFPGNWTLEGDFTGDIVDSTTGGDGFTNAPGTV